MPLDSEKTYEKRFALALKEIERCREQFESLKLRAEHAERELSKWRNLYQKQMGESELKSSGQNRNR